MADLESAERKIDEVILGFMTKDPILLNVFCMINRRPDPKQETAGLDIRTKNVTLVYNPNFVNAVSVERLEMVLITEAFKVLLRHCTTRLKKPRQISALASSITINQLLNGDVMKVINGLEDVTPSPTKFGLEVNKYFEEYYRNLMDKAEETNDKIKQIWNSMSDEQKQDVIDKSQQSQSQDGEGEGEPSSGQGGGYKEYNDSDQAMKDYFDPNGTTNDGWGENQMFDEDVKNFIDSKKNSAQGWGKHTGNCMAQIIAANSSKVSYKDLLRRFRKTVTQSNTISSRMKINRRHDIQSPGYRRTYTSRLMFGVDVSGSMGDDVLAEGFAVINNIFKHAEIIFVQFDTEIKSIEKKIKSARDTFSVHGRGGTDFQCIIDLAEKERVDGLIIFTDGFASAPNEPKNTKVLWLLHDDNQKPPVDWGHRVYLKLFEDIH